MLFRRALLRELTATAIAVFLVVLAIGISRQLVRVLDLAAGGSVPSDSVFALLGFSALKLVREIRAAISALHAQ